MNFQQQAALVAPERAVLYVGRPDRIGHGAEGLSAYGQGTGKLENFLPVLVLEGLRREHARVEFQAARAYASAVLLVEVPGNDLMPDTRRIIRDRLPASVQIDGVELLVLLQRKRRGVLL